MRRDEIYDFDDSVSGLPIRPGLYDPCIFDFSSNIAMPLDSGSLESLRDGEPELYRINYLFSCSISVLQSSSGELKI